MKRTKITTYLMLCISLITLLAPGAALTSAAAKENSPKAKLIESINTIEKPAIDKIVRDKIKVEEKLKTTTQDLEINITNAVASNKNKTTPFTLSPITRTANAFDWGGNTAVFRPGSMHATTDIDILWDRFVDGEQLPQYDLFGTGIGSFLPKIAEETNSQDNFEEFVNEGRVNDYLGYQTSLHQYIVNVSENINSMTFLNSANVRTLVVTEDGFLCLDTGYHSNGAALSAQAFPPALYCSIYETTSFDTPKDVFYLTVPAGRYYIIQTAYNNTPVAMSNVDTLDPAYHYAFYVGKALPELRSTETTIDVGNINYPATSSSVLQLTFTADPSLSSLYGLKKLRLDGMIPFFMGSLNALMTDYQYKLPDMSQFDSLVRYDSYSLSVPTEAISGSLIGNYQFYYETYWSNQAKAGVDYIRYGGTLEIDYLIPFGSNL